MERDAFVRTIVDAYNRHRPEDFGTLVTDDCTMIRNGVEAHGREAVQRVLGKLFRALPDVEYTIDDVILAGDKLALRWRGRGTSRGDILGVPANGRELRSQGITIYELRDGRISRIWVSAAAVSDEAEARL